VFLSAYITTGPVPDFYLLHAFAIENAYQAAANREPKSGSLYK